MERTVVYSVCEMNGLFRVYKHNGILIGLKTFKTERGARTYIKKTIAKSKGE